ncbi:hypothetical protein AHS81_23905 [Salmonella enterica]|nr:hypothetical protein [Salmonella enterica]EAP0278998.1 hypothetical protein [Salmonella enterica]EAS2604975.1 hypothetical protein [Salmonella enterica]
MLGFVSALSATLAIIVLIASVMLVNLLSVSMEKSKQKFQIKFSGINESKTANYDDGKKKGDEQRKENHSNSRDQKLMISKYVISPKDLPSANSNVVEIETGCSYGNNFSYDVASKLSSLNYIILLKKYVAGDVKVNIQKPTYHGDGINDCWVNAKSNRNK